jgi:hypothetical protein
MPSIISWKLINKGKRIFKPVFGMCCSSGASKAGTVVVGGSVTTGTIAGTVVVGATVVVVGATVVVGAKVVVVGRAVVVVGGSQVTVADTVLATPLTVAVAV